VAQKRRFGTEQSGTRTVILDTTERVLIEEGYAAVTTRHVAERAGIKAPLVHYYYKTTEDLLVAVYRRAAERSLQRHTDAMAREDLLQALWDVNIEQDRTALALEFLAMANHRKFIQEEIARYAEQIRAIQTVALNRYFSKLDIAPALFPPVSISVVLAGIARALVLEAGVGIHLGHAETREAMEGFLKTLRSEPPHGNGDT
jgi:AcrR family transcriptional regulator